MNELLPKISNLFRKYGIKSVTMDDIARDLGISKKTLYLHFKNRNDMVHKIAEYEIDSEFKDLDKLYNGHPHVIDQLLVLSKYIADKNRSLNTSIIYSMNKYYPQIWKKIMNQSKKYILNLITKNLYNGIEQGLYRKDLNIDIIHIFYSFLLDIKSIEMYNGWLDKDFDKVFNTLFMYHIRGIANKEGIEYLEKQFQKRNKLLKTKNK